VSERQQRSPHPPAAKLATPDLYAGLLRRSSLERRLDTAFGKRLAVVIADAGFGKSSLLRAWVSDLEYAWYTLTEADLELETLVRGVAGALRRAIPRLPALAASGAIDVAGADAQAAWLCELLNKRLQHDFMLVLDDVHEIGKGTPSARFVESLCRQAPPYLHLVLASRADPPFRIDRLRGQGAVLELTGSMLAFDVNELAELILVSTGNEDRGLAEALVQATGGWPAAVRLALDAFQREPDGTSRESALAQLQRPGGELYDYLAGEALAGDPPAIRELLRRLSPFDRISVELCTALGVPDADVAMSSLVRRGLAAEVPDGGHMLHGLVREFARHTWPLEAEEALALHRRAAVWLSAHGRTEDALRALAATEDHEALAGLLVEQGPALLAAGSAGAVVRLSELLPVALRNASVDQVVGEAHAALGHFEDALAWFRSAAGDEDRLAPALAWRIVRANHLHGDLDEAVRTYERSVGIPGEPKDEALLLAWTATAQVRRGETDAGKALAARALETADRSGDPGAIAAAHTAEALVAEAIGDLDLSASHTRRALAAAERANDVLQLSRIRNNRASVLTTRGLYRDGIDELELAISLAERVAFPSMLGLALMNRGFCHWCLGELDEANADYTAAIAVYRSSGGTEISYALIGRGDVYRERGDQARARTLYEEGLAIAERTGDRQALVPGLYQLAKVLVDDDPARAVELAERAVGYDWPDHVWALNAVGWIALAQGDRVKAGEVAARAEASARELGDRFGLAESLELRTFALSSGADDPHWLDEAIEIWRELGNRVHETAAELARARLDSSVAAQAVAQRAEQRLRALGVRVSRAGPAGLLRTIALQTDAPVAIQTLGGFHVRRLGEPIPLAEWRSKKARDLVKILACRYGVPTPRDRLMEALWPGADPNTLSNRLSVALSTVRLVLDPERRFTPDHFIVADKDAVKLRTESVSVDLQLFLHDAAEGLSLRRSGQHAEAAERLRAAEEAYTGDFLEEDAYQDWAAPVRDQAVAAYIDVVRALAEDARATGDHDAAVRFYLRLLERDRFDESAHLDLIATLGAAGRFGEARRRYGVYCSCMQEIDLEAAPFAAAERV
jgi:ATP/maltotriose-dependent transcriptional regulator MalT/DNA-binding SARP family transcriptional activator